MRIARIVGTVVASGVFGLAPAAAQNYPVKSVRIINPYPAGGAADSLLRPIAAKMGESLKTSFVIDNRPGANGIIGTEIASKLPADGYSLLMGSTSSLPMNAAIYPKLPFDPAKDFAPISTFMYSSLLLLVHPSVPVTTVKDFITFAKSRPEQISCGSFGIGSTAHFAIGLVGTMSGAKLNHVPYKGSAPLIIDLLAGQIASSFDTTQNAMAHVRHKKIRSLGVAALQRLKNAPEIPTIAESGIPGFDIGVWFGLFAPANTPRDIVLKLNGEVAKAMTHAEVRDLYTATSAEPLTNTPDEFVTLLRNEMAKWAKVAREANIRGQ